MAKPDNYAIQAQDAKNRFLTYDQEKIIEKFRLPADADYLYPMFLGSPYRLHRKTGDLERKKGEAWVDGNSFGEVMTLLDMLCDAQDHRCLSGRYKQLPKLVKHYRTKEITITCDKESPINLDGELRLAQKVTMKLAQEKIRFFYPKGLTWKQETSAEAKA